MNFHPLLGHAGRRSSSSWLLALSLLVGCWRSSVCCEVGAAECGPIVEAGDEEDVMLLQTSIRAEPDLFEMVNATLSDKGRQAVLDSLAAGRPFSEGSGQQLAQNAGMKTESGEPGVVYPSIVAEAQEKMKTIKGDLKKVAGPLKRAVNTISSDSGVEPSPLSRYVVDIVFFLYTCACIVFEMRSPPDMRLGIPGSEKFDCCKLGFGFGVVWLHSELAMTSIGHLLAAKRIWYFTPCIVPSFVFISGIFSNHCTFFSRSWVKALVGASCMLVFYQLLVAFMSVILPGPTVFNIFRSTTGVEWFLACLIFWRCLFAPIFLWCKSKKVPASVLYAAGFVLSYFAFFGWFYGHPLPKSADVLLTEGIKNITYPAWGGPWLQVAYFLPLFLAGLVFTPAEWTELLHSKSLKTIAIMALFIWFYGLETSKAFREFAITTCTEQPRCHGTFWPAGLNTGQMDGKAFEVWTLAQTQTILVVLAFIWSSGSLADLLDRVFPWIITHFQGAGTRAVYVYILHWPLWIMPLRRTHDMAVIHTWAGDSHWRIILISWTVTLVLSSKLTGTIFGNVLSVPLMLINMLKPEKTPANDMLSPAKTPAK